MRKKTDYDLVHKFWKLDAINVLEESDTDALERFKENIKFENGRYTVCLPWKEAVVKLEESRDRRRI